MRGCDISEFQGSVNFDQLKTASSFVIIRAGYTGGSDKQFKRNQSESRRVGILRGYYWFAYPDRVGSSQVDADAFVNAVGDLQDGEVMVLDYEVNTGSTQWCKDFLDRVQQRTGVKAYLYTNQNRTVSLNWSSVKDAGYPLWVALFDNKPDENVNTGGWSYPMKQFTADGRMPGIGGAVDLDEFYGDEDKFKSYGKGDEMFEGKSAKDWAAIAKDALNFKRGVTAMRAWLRHDGIDQDVERLDDWGDDVQDWKDQSILNDDRINAIFQAAYFRKATKDELGNWQGKNPNALIAFINSDLDHVQKPGSSDGFNESDRSMLKSISETVRAVWDKITSIFK